MKTIALLSLLVPCLLQSYEEAVQKLAEDLAKVETASGKVGIGDEYVKLLKKYPKKRQEIIDAASECYVKAWPDLDPFWKTKTREHLVKLYMPPVPGRGGNLPDGWSGPVDSAHKICLTSERVHSGGTSAKLIPGSKARNARLLYTPELKGSGKKARFSAWVLSDGTDGSGDEIRFYLDESIHSIKIPKDLPIWTKLSYDIDISGGSFSKASMEIVAFSREGTIYIDDLSVNVDGKELLQGGGLEK